jgi:hypothetical protein
MIAQTAPDASLIENEEDADLSGGVEVETDSSLNFQGAFGHCMNSQLTLGRTINSIQYS